MVPRDRQDKLRAIAGIIITREVMRIIIHAVLTMGVITVLIIMVIHNV
jgi:hypothetical protein